METYLVKLQRYHLQVNNINLTTSIKETKNRNRRKKKIVRSQDNNKIKTARRIVSLVFFFSFEDAI